MIVVSEIVQPARNAIHPARHLVNAAHEFEAQLMQELLKPMTRAMGMEDDAEAGSGGALGDFAAESLGQALSWHGGLGIADSIIRNLSRNETPSQSIPGPAIEESGTKVLQKVTLK